MATALLVIDVQEGMEPEKGAHDGAGVIARIAQLIERARKSGTRVIYVQHDGSAEPGHPLAKGKPGHAIHHAIAPDPGETIIGKRQCSSFVETDLDRTLRLANIDHLVVCGMQTEFCVDTAIRSAREHGYRVTLVSDAHTTGDTPVMKAKDIVAHHNFTLREFADVKPAEGIKL
jgi:nicotinamidase-related amidase